VNAAAVGTGGFARRFAQYCRERFPPLQHGVVIAAFVFATLGIARSAGGGAALAPRAFGLGFALALLAFLELRILDEFKDAADDARYRPYRPVPRGLVTLRELRAVGLAAVVVQAGLAALAGPAAVALLVVALAYMALMGREFFASRWLRARPIAYMASHAVVVPLLALLVAACSGEAPAVAGFAPYLALAYTGSTVFELGRKIRAPIDEQTGVETYSALWGARRAVGLWWAVLAVSALLAVAAAPSGGDRPLVAALAATTTALAAAVAARFAAAPTPGAGKRIEALSGLWLVASYVALGIVGVRATP
jgi:4-hydroxybenzoate polyprenyltransferase